MKFNSFLIYLLVYVLNYTYYLIREKSFQCFM